MCILFICECVNQSSNHFQTYTHYTSITNQPLLQHLVVHHLLRVICFCILAIMFMLVTILNITFRLFKSFQGPISHLTFGAFWFSNFSIPKTPSKTVRWKNARVFFRTNISTTFFHIRFPALTRCESVCACCDLSEGTEQDSMENRSCTFQEQRSVWLARYRTFVFSAFVLLVHERAKTNKGLGWITLRVFEFVSLSVSLCVCV